MHSPGIEQRSLPLERLLASRSGQIGLIAAFAIVGVLETRLSHPAPAAGAGTRAVVLNVLAIGPLLLARRWPTGSAVAATLITVALLGEHNAPLVVAPFCAMVILIVQLVIRRGLPFAAPLVLPFLVNAVQPLDGSHHGLVSAWPLLIVVSSLAVGESMRSRGLAVAALGETQEAMADSIRARIVMEERARIARELHDIVAHHLSVIAVESEAARLTSPELSPDAGGRFEAIASTAREALTETRRLLGVLREDSGGEAELGPQPGLDQLGDLLDKARATGTPVRFIQEGSVMRLPLGLDLAAYRIIQEALTNARRHAPAAHVDVEVSYSERALRLRIRDAGPGVPPGELVAGHGLMGMRERAALAGGTFAAGTAAGGGFEVDVTLPISETPA